MIQYWMKIWTIRNALLQGLGDDDGVLMKVAATATTQGKQRETD